MVIHLLSPIKYHCPLVIRALMSFIELKLNYLTINTTIVARWDTIPTPDINSHHQRHYTACTKSYQVELAHTVTETNTRYVYKGLTY